MGTAIATLVRKADHVPAEAVGFRHLWGQGKREELLETAEAAPDALYADVSPLLPLGLPFVQTAVSEGWFDWPALPDLFPVSFPGVQTKRDSFLVDAALDRLKKRIAGYFDPEISHEEIARRYPAAMKSSSGFVVRDSRAVRDALLARGGPDETGFVRHAYRPFDNRWLYWEAGHGLLGRPVPDYRPQVFEGNMWLSAAQHLRKDASEPQSCISEHLASLHLIERTALMFPAWLRDDDIGSDNNGSRNPEAWLPDPAARRIGSDGDDPRNRPNLSGAARRYLEYLGLSTEDLFHHVLAVLHDPAYREANAGALAMEWPRIPLPGWPTPGSAGVPPATDRRSGAEGPPPSKAGVSPVSTRSVLSPTPAGGTPALPGGSSADEDHKLAEECVFPGSGASDDVGVPPADESDLNARESRTTPSGQVGRMDAAKALAQSAARGRELARLLDPDIPVPGVTSGTLIGRYLRSSQNRLQSELESSFLAISFRM